MTKHLMRYIRFCALAMDVITLNLFFTLLAFFTVPESYSLFSGDYYQFLICLNISWILTSWLGFLYFEKYLLEFEAFCRRTGQIYLVWLAVSLFYLFFAQQYTVSRTFIVLIFGGFAFLLACNRVIYLWIRQYVQRTPFFIRKVVVIGYNPVAKKLVTYLEEEGRYTKVLGYCEERLNVSELSHYPILSTIQDTLKVSKKLGVEEIYSTIAPEENRDIYKLIAEADHACIRFRIVPDLHSIIDRSFRVSYLNDLPVMSLRNPHVDDPANLFRKRIFDILFSSFLFLTVFPWLFPLIALLIKVDSRGPVFFKQQRTGKNNNVFWCLKFRSMRTTDEADSKQASRNDQRQTRIGKLLRKTSLDELPQFWNVLVGDMSVVGPRPHMVQHTNEYAKLINDYMVRQFLKPGVTGWAQVNGLRGETRNLSQMQRRVEYDIWYMENWSLWLDVKIIFLTVFVVIKGDNAY